MAETTDQPKYPNVEVELVGVDSHPFSIVSKVQRAMRREGISKEEQEAFRKEALSGDYDNVIQTAMKWVDVVG